MQRLPAMVSGTVIMAPVSDVAPEFQSYYNTLTLEPQDVLLFAAQIVSGMVSTETTSSVGYIVTGLFHFPRSSWPA